MISPIVLCSPCFMVTDGGELEIWTLGGGIITHFVKVGYQMTVLKTLIQHKIRP